MAAAIGKIVGKVVNTAAHTAADLGHPASSVGTAMALEGGFYSARKTAVERAKNVAKTGGDDKYIDSLAKHIVDYDVDFHQVLRFLGGKQNQIKLMKTLLKRPVSAGGPLIQRNRKIRRDRAFQRALGRIERNERIGLI